MNTICFDPRALEAWAEFSGDRNPVHFDAEVARELLGTDGTIVHGMLAMLPLKRHVAEAIPAAAMHDWRWEALLRRPVLCADTYAVRSYRRRTDGALAVDLEAGTGAVRAISSRLVPVALNPVAAEAPLHLLLPDDVALRYRRFNDTFPDAAPLWIFYDALLFACYLDGHLIGLLEQMQFPLREPRGAMSEGVAILQISHTLEIGRDLLRHEAAPPGNRLGYRIASPCVSGNGNTRYATVRTTLLENDHPLLVQEMSLAIQHRVQQAAP